MALSKGDPAMIFFGFSAAFPSIARGYTLKAFEAPGAPINATDVMETFYEDTNCDMSRRGNNTWDSDWTGESDKGAHSPRCSTQWEQAAYSEG